MINNVTIHMFDPVTVQISVDSNNIQRQRIQLHLIKPHIEGFSVAPIEKSKSVVDDTDRSGASPVKRMKVKSSK